MTADDMNASDDNAERAHSGGSTSRSLLADARLADPAAWERVVRLYAPLVASWCRRWGVAEQDAGDVLQDVFGSVASHLDRFRKDRPTDTFRGWLSTIARNKVHDYFRVRAAEPTAAGGTEAALRWNQIAASDVDVSSQHADASSQNFNISPAGDADDPLIDDLLRSALEAIRGEFHERTWRAFWGVVVDGRSAADVAADLDMKPGTVRVAKSRVLLRLRRELGDLPN